MNKRTKWILLILILLLAVFFRLWQLNYDANRLPSSIPPGLFPDEAMNGNNVHEALGTRENNEGFKVFYRENNGREGLFINLQALSIALFGHTSFALRVVSAIFGILTVLAIYLFTKEYLKNEAIALLAAFFTATSFWHIMFSRIGFRAIMAPFFLTIGIYFLLLALNKVIDAFRLPGEIKKQRLKIIIFSVIGGALYGLGFYSYIAYRATPILILALVLFYWLENKDSVIRKEIILSSCIFLVFTFVAVLPLGLYFISQPQDFFGRTAQISIFSAPNPVLAFLENTGKTLQMFYFFGDFNWRHNLAGRPALWWPVALFFTLGIIQSFRKKYFLLLLWFLAMLLPVVLSAEGVPHALRAIIMIPPVMIFAAIGFYTLTHSAINWLSQPFNQFRIDPERNRTGQFSSLSRKTVIKVHTAQKLILILAAAVLIIITVESFDAYFTRWAPDARTKDAFAADLYESGLFLKKQPDDIFKYVITDEVETIDVTGRPMSLQPILFATETYLPDFPEDKNIFFITMRDIDSIDCSQECLIVPIGNYEEIKNALQQFMPSLESIRIDGVPILRFAQQLN